VVLDHGCRHHVTGFEGEPVGQVVDGSVVLRHKIATSVSGRLANPRTAVRDSS